MEKRFSWLGLGFVIAVFALAFFAADIARSQDETPAVSYMDQYTGADAEKIGSEVCLGCHADRNPETPFTHLALFDLNAGNSNYGNGCEACHGPGGNHFGKPEGILDPLKMSSDEQTDLCSKCHTSLRTYDRQSWLLSEHYSAEMKCTACHSGHTPNAKFLIKDNPLDLCFSCHANTRGEFSMRSHHPVTEGQMTCDDCHTPMSGVYGTQLKEEGDELCFGCHADKQGPFAFDHNLSAAAGYNGCLTCHFVHGSNTDSMLRFPHRLCLQCHSDQTAENHYAGTCWSTGCHQEIHGSYTSPLFFQ
jgi:DmsE family decaheme c-type cytochrome